MQVIPHVTEAIKERLRRIAEQSSADIVISEIGGTIGDIESLPFIEAARQFKKEKPLGDVLFVHVTLVPYIAAAHEVKTKPTQHSVKELRSIGVQPDFIVCRSDHEITDKVREKIALFCDVRTEEVLACTDAPSIYEVPIGLHSQGFDAKVLERLGLAEREIDLSPMRAFLEATHRCDGQVDVAVVGKYVSLPDAYLSVIEALGHAGVHHGCHVEVHLIDGEELSDTNAADVLGGMDGVLVPGGFGQRAFEGKIAAARYARENDVPYLGICLGLQAAVCEFARHVAGLEGATSAEFDEEAAHPVIDLMPEQEDVEDKGGTMRLGAYPCKVARDTKAFAAYGEEVVYERHRHRFEVNNAYRDRLVEAGLAISGISPNERLVEMVELPGHPWFVASQGHPEFKSRPTRPHPLFSEFVAARLGHPPGRRRNRSGGCPHASARCGLRRFALRACYPVGERMLHVNHSFVASAVPGNRRSWRARLPGSRRLLWRMRLLKAAVHGACGSQGAALAGVDDEVGGWTSCSGNIWTTCAWSAAARRSP